MKKIVLMFAMLTSFAYSQTLTGNDPRLPVIPRDPNGIRGAVMLGYDAATSTYFNVYGQGNMLVKFDSLTATDTVKTIYFGNKYTDVFLTLYDSLGKVSTDTFYVERYDTLSPQASKFWTQQQVAFVDLSNVQYTTSVTGRYGYAGTNVITPGVGVTKTYYIAEFKPMTYRVWVNAGDVAGGKRKFFKWTGKNR